MSKIYKAAKTPQKNIYGFYYVQKCLYRLYYGFRPFSDMLTTGTELFAGVMKNREKGHFEPPLFTLTLAQQHRSLLDN